MRMSCNGCRVLRKGCSDNCSIRPCLQWIKNPESQANATVFLAKFYGRAGLMNLINAGPDHLRPAIFRSLLYEACGRIVNPIYGSVGLLWSGNWQLCQAAVKAVLKGAPIIQIPSETAASTPVPPLNIKAYDIRHVTNKVDHEAGSGSGSASHLHKVNKTPRNRFKRTSAASAKSPRPTPPDSSSPDDDSADHLGLSWHRCHPRDFQRARSHESSASHANVEPAAAAAAGTGGDGDSRENESMFSVETSTVEASHVSQGEPNEADDRSAAAADEDEEEEEVGLELTLGFEPSSRRSHSTQHTAPPESRCKMSCCDDDSSCRVDLALELPA